MECTGQNQGRQEETHHPTHLSYHISLYWFFNRLNIWVRSRNCGCLVTWFCYQLIAKPGNKTATVSWPDPYVMDHLWVKVELMGPKLYKEIGGIIFDESYLPRISKPFYLNWQTFHHNNIAFWYWIFFCINGKSPLKDWLEHHVLMVVVLIMMSQYMCTRALSKSYIAMHHSVGARDLSANHTLRCTLCLAMKAIWWSTPIVSWRFISR